MSTKYIVILATVPSENLAIEICKSLVTNKLVACAQIDSSITSIYSWQDRIEEDKEWRIVAKSSSEKYEAVEALIQSVHPYEVPQIVALPIADGYNPYLDWIDSIVTGKTN